MDEYSEYNCIGCSYKYSPSKGDKTRSIGPGTSFESLPDDWTCPECGANKLGFKVELGHKKGNVEDDQQRIEARSVGWKSSINR